MNLLTLNTHSWMEDKNINQVQILGDAIIQNDYDIIALQEVNQKIDSAVIKNPEFFHPTENQASIHSDNFAYQLVLYLAAHNATYHWSWVYNHVGYDIYQEGVALLSKEPIIASSLVASLENNPESYRRREILIGETSYKGKKVSALSCHYSWWNDTDGFEHAWNQTLHKLETFQTPVILMGDFNCPASSRNEGYDLIMSSNLNLIDTYTHAKSVKGDYTIEKSIDGWGENTQNLRIDYIFTSDVFSINSYRTVFDGTETPTISDHLGIEVEIEFKE